MSNRCPLNQIRFIIGIVTFGISLGCLSFEVSTHEEIPDGLPLPRGCRISCLPSVLAAYARVFQTL